MEEKILSYLFNNCYLRADLLHRLSVLEAFLEYYFYQNQTPNFTIAQKQYLLKEELGNSDKNILLSYPFELFSLFSLDNFYELIKKTRKHIERMENLTISLPFEPKELEKLKIGRKVSSLLSGRKVILDFRFDPNLFAGCALIFKGVYKDYSLSKILTNKDSEIAGIVSSYS